jgi:RimJ/RimL family protein N-acetyltransferase
MLSPANADEALAYLERRPAESVYVYWLIASGQLARTGRCALWRDATGHVGGCCYIGLQLVPAGESNDALDAFAEYARQAPRARMIVGVRGSVERLWRTLVRTMPAPSAIRVSQPIYVLARSGLAPGNTEAEVALATLDDLDEIVANSAMMIAGELGGDPRRTNADFRARTARIIAAGWWWTYRVDERLAFMCNIGSIMPQTAQIQGVWSPPAMRGRGYAARALGAICDRLLDTTPTLSLYVNDFNRSAIALYERVGFERAGECQSILF